MAHQGGEEIELTVGQRDVRPGEAGNPARQVQRKSARCQPAGEQGLGPQSFAAAQQGLDPPHHLPGAERLEHVVVRTEVDAEERVLLVTAAPDDDHGVP